MLNCWLPPPPPPHPDHYSAVAASAALYCSPSVADQSLTSAASSSSSCSFGATSTQPSPAINNKSEHMVKSASAAGDGPMFLPSSVFCTPSFANNGGPSYANSYAAHHQHLAKFVNSAFGTVTAGFGGGGAPSERPRQATKRKAKQVAEEKKDQVYRERRRKNNDSARRSRELRRRKEEETQQRNGELEEENARLRQENYGLMLELFQLRQYFGIAVGNGGNCNGGMMNSQQIGGIQQRLQKMA